MSEQSSAGNASPAGPPGQPQVQARAVAQYIKDLSFENPNIERLLSGPGENPNLQIEVNVGAKPVAEGMFESAITLNAQATNKAGVIYELEVVYAGLFKIENMPQQALEPFLLVNCPTLIFPFMRRLIADVTREGGFPPLMLEPIDFAALYVRGQQQGQAGNDNVTPPTAAN
jgi:preprotein translocase subunit SecB